MMRATPVAGALVALAVTAGPVLAQAADPAPTPADGYTVHVTAPHLHQGQETAPVHHWCKTHSPEPIIVCLLTDTDDPGSHLHGVEYIVAKSLTRPAITRGAWNSYFHDHEVEIAGGRVKVHGLSPEQTAEVVELVKTTDGIIFHLWPEGDVFPTGSVAIDQAVGHRPLTEAEYAASQRELAEASGQ